MIVETNNQSKLGELRINKDESFTIKTDEHTSLGSELSVYYSEGPEDVQVS